MKKILTLALVLGLVAVNCYATQEWKKGTNSDVIASTDNPTDTPTLLKNYSTDPLDILLTHYIWGATLSKTSSQVCTISAGELSTQNTGDTIHKFRKNTSTTTVDLNTTNVAGGLDTGTVAASTMYYIYANADAATTTFTCCASLSATSPTGVTNYRILGAVLTDGSKYILNFFWYGNGAEIRIHYDVPILMSNALSTSAWTASNPSTLAAGNCASVIPAISNVGIFGISETKQDTASGVWIRPNGSTWSVVDANGIGVANGSGGIAYGWAGQRLCFTDASQKINYYTTSTVVAIYVEGYLFKR